MPPLDEEFDSDLDDGDDDDDAVPSPGVSPSKSEAKPETPPPTRPPPPPIDQFVEITQLKQGTWIEQRRASRSIMLHASFSADGSRLCSSASDKQAWLFSTENWEPLLRFDHKDWVRRVELSPDGKIIATCCDDKYLRLWNVEMSTFRKPILAKELLCENRLTDVTWSECNNYVMSASWDGNVRIFGEKVHFDETGYRVGMRVWARNLTNKPELNGKEGGIVERDEKQRRWRVKLQWIEEDPDDEESEPEKKEYEILVRVDNLKLTGRVTCNACNGKGMLGSKGILKCEACKTTGIVNVEDQEEPEPEKPHVILRRPSTPSAVGEQIDAGIWMQWQELEHLPHDHGVNSARWSSCGTRVATACCDNFLRLWDMQTHTEMHAFEHQDWVLSCAFSPDGKFLGTGSRDTTARIYMVDSGKERAQFQNSNAVNHVCFSPDGSQMVVAGDEGIVWIHDIEGRRTGQLAPEERILSHGMSRDGYRFCVALGNATIRVYEAPEPFEALEEEREVVPDFDQIATTTFTIPNEQRLPRPLSRSGRALDEAPA